jgi:hypothetical protein
MDVSKKIKRNEWKITSGKRKVMTLSAECQYKLIQVPSSSESIQQGDLESGMDTGFLDFVNEYTYG